MQRAGYRVSHRLHPGKIEPAQLPCVVYAFQKTNVMRRQPVGSSTLAQQRDIAERWSAIDILALSHVSDPLGHPTITIFGLDLNMPAPAPRYSFRRVQAQQVASRNPVKYAPSLRAGVGVQINR